MESGPASGKSCISRVAHNLDNTQYNKYFHNLKKIWMFLTKFFLLSYCTLSVPRHSYLDKATKGSVKIVTHSWSLLSSTYASALAAIQNFKSSNLFI
jgi:hypothetical protein